MFRSDKKGTGNYTISTSIRVRFLCGFVLIQFVVYLGYSEHNILTFCAVMDQQEWEFHDRSQRLLEEHVV